MTRYVPEWIGATDDAPIPPRVRLRVWQRYGGRCQCCERPIFVGEAWQVDHIVALANGGEHRELNLRPILTEHHKAKTRADVAEKSKTYERRKKHLSIKTRKDRPLPGTRASGIRKRMSGAVERWPSETTRQR